MNERTHMNDIRNIQSLFKHWKKCNKQFRAWGEIKSECWEQAIESFVHFLELHNIKPIDAEKYIVYIDHSINYVYYIWPIVLVYIVENFLLAFNATTQVRFCISALLVIMVVLHFPLRWLIQSGARDMTTDDNSFLKIALKCYLERHKVSDSLKRLTDVRGKRNVSTPPDAEFVYDEKMTSSKYYWTSHLIEMKDYTQPFTYVFFVNRAYSNDVIMKRFQMQCHEQIGKLWDDNDIAQATITKLEPAHFWDYTINNKTT